MAAGWSNYDVVNWHKTCRGIWDIVTEPRIIDVMADLLGDTVVLRHSHLFAKLPGDPKRVSWHQDASYWPLTPSRVVSAWLAIDDVDVANSAMQVIPGSHHHAQLTFRDSTAAENNVLYQTVDNDADYGDAPVALESGVPGGCGTRYGKRRKDHNFSGGSGSSSRDHARRCDAGSDAYAEQARES